MNRLRRAASERGERRHEYVMVGGGSEVWRGRRRMSLPPVILRHHWDGERGLVFPAGESEGRIQGQGETVAEPGMVCRRLL